MASFRFRSNSWQARVRRKGHPDEVRSFITRQDAERWARSVETEMDRGAFTSTAEAEKHTFADLAMRYSAEVLRGNKHEKLHAYRLNALARGPVGRLNLLALTPAALAKHRDDRLKRVSAATVIRELAFISSIINHARKELGINIANPVALVRKPVVPKGRDRLLGNEELQAVLDQLEPVRHRSIWMKPLVLLALETAMRRGELLALNWKDVHLEQRYVTLWETKNGDKRTVPLSTAAVTLLEALPESIDGRVFPINYSAVAKAWRIAVKRAGLVDIHFHDLRHMAVTRMASKLPNLIELAAVSGHRSLSMLKRYYHPSVMELAQKLG